MDDPEPGTQEAAKRTGAGRLCLSFWAKGQIPGGQFRWGLVGRLGVGLMAGLRVLGVGVVRAQLASLKRPPFWSEA